MATIDDFEKAILKTTQAKAAFIKLVDGGKHSYEQVRLLMVNQNKITMARASDEIAFLESITGKSLKR